MWEAIPGWASALRVSAHTVPGNPSWAALVTLPTVGTAGRAQIQPLQNVHALADVYLPETYLPWGPVHFTRARQTTACRMPRVLVSQCCWQPAQASLSGHCRHRAQLPATLPGQQPSSSLILVPPPAAAAGLTPSNLAHKTSPGEGSSLVTSPLPPGTGLPHPQPPPLQTCPPLFDASRVSSPNPSAFPPKSSPQGVTALAEPKPTPRVPWSRRRSIQSPRPAPSPVSPSQSDTRSSLHPWEPWFAPHHICSVDSVQ